MTTKPEREINTETASVQEAITQEDGRDEFVTEVLDSIVHDSFTSNLRSDN